ncbi:MAG: oxygen-dependent coproporphyrinogen oxidase, partial [Bacteroidota bacterium]
MINKEDIRQFFKNLQDDICQNLEKADGKGKFQEDLWERPGGGGGATRIIQDGLIIEKGGVNFSAVQGELPQILQDRMGFAGGDFFATGVSIVIHPLSPKVPIIHMNVRYFEMSNGRAWFGGGIDLTPHYIDPDEAQFFHQSLQKVCDQHHPSYYPEFKKWADDYFYIKHRQETRGIGGIFFDRLSQNDQFRLEDRFSFVKDVGNSFSPIYLHLIEKNKGREFSPREKQFQLLRRGRYVEFNLVYDQGTKFGLETQGRIESILMSLPKEVNWLYNFQA